MDQDDTKGQDKRNWRERLGIGAAGNKDLPKISDDYRKDQPDAARPAGGSRPAPRPVAAASTVKPAPMAPRANPKPPAPTAQPVPPDKLAERLRSQREASTRLAEQRVQNARQRGEAPQQQQPQAAAPRPQAPQQQPQGTAPANRPKFTFAADEGQQGQPPRINAPVPQQGNPQASKPQPAPPPQMAPARPPLGVPPQPAFQARPPQPQQYAPPAGAPTPPAGYGQGYQRPGYQPAYVPQQAVPPYRPIDPATGYPPQQRPYAAPPGGGYAPPPVGPRLNVPARSNPTLPPTYSQQPEFNAGPGALPPAGRMQRQQPRAPLASDDGYGEEYYDDAPAPRGGRGPSRGDYHQAYRDAEGGYEDEQPRSRAPLILASLLLLTLAVAAAGVWGYQKFGRQSAAGQTASEQVPAVAAPQEPAKVQPEQNGQTAAPAGAPTKKQIYDRIVGDQEILGGEVNPSEEVPAQIPEPAPASSGAPQPATGEDAAPLPIPPPVPGASGQQGALDLKTEKQSAENITPAASESEAAVATSKALDAAAPPAPAAVANVEVPAPGELPQQGVEAPAPAVEAIADEDPPPIKKKVVTETKKKVLADKSTSTRSLGSKPVVLVPPSKKFQSAASETFANDEVASVSNSAPATGGNGGLYGGDALAAPVATTPAKPVDVKKKKTLADLFKNGQEEEAAADTVNTNVIEQPVSPAPKPVTLAPAKKIAAPEPQPQQQASAGGYAIQLASFRTRGEATTEYSRMKAKYGSALSGLSPIVSEATVGGSTRYRLSVGSMASREQADAVCSKLFAAGERDCLVKKQ